MYFVEKYDLETRKAESQRVIGKYNDRIPLICEKAKHSDVPEIDKHKYLVPRDLTVGQFIYVIRKRINIKADKAVYFFINNTLLPTASMMGPVYERYKDKDGFLYIKYSSESTFGCILR